MKKAAALMLMLLTLAFSSAAAYAQSEWEGEPEPRPGGIFLEVYGGVEYFRWSDSTDNNLDAKGPVWLGGVNVDINPPESILTASFRGEGFAGNIEDDSVLIDNEVFVVETDVRGFKFEGDLGLVKRMDNMTIGPFAGLGFRWWEFDATTWRSSYGRVGLRARLHPVDSPLETVIEGGVRLPIDASVRGVVVEGDTAFPVSLDVREQVAPFAEIGIRLHMLKLSVFYEGLRFDGVRDVDAPVLDVHNDIVGARLGLVFY